MTNIDKDRKNRSVLSAKEFNLLRAEARVNPFGFLAYRNEAMLCMLRLFGKRRAEYGCSGFSPGLLRDDVWVDEEYINFSFKVLKKHKFPLPEYLKKVSVKDSLAYPILNYINYLDNLDVKVDYFLPSAKNVFGNYIISHSKCLPSRCVYDVVRGLGDACGVVVWPHLFRETVGGEEISKDPSVYGVAKVANRLNIHERTAWAYMERYVMNIVKSEQSGDQ